jgi:3-hydroxybutyryl-CoA dehydratase
MQSELTAFILGGKMEIGMSASRTLEVTAEAIDLFAQASGDRNPIHLDEDYASQTQFGKRIAHGMLTVSVISSILGNDLPGEGSIYLGQEVKFKAPVFIGDTITATVELIKFREDKRIATFRTYATNQDGKTVLDGEAVLIAPEGA